MRDVLDGIQSAQFSNSDTSLARKKYLKRFKISVFSLLLLGILSIAILFGKNAELLYRLWKILPPGHYLVLFQNNAELRPSGGFIGSFAVVDIGMFGINRYKIDTNIYKRDNAFIEQYSIQPPAALLRNLGLGTKWAMRDANWDLDFRDAAARTAWFYEQEGGESVDGVIAINASVVQDVLQLTGPMTLPSLNGLLSSDTYFAVLAQEVEQDYFKDPKQQTQNEPKSVLKDMLPILLSKSKKPTVAIKLTNVARQELTEKQIQFFHFKPAIEERIIEAGWGGVIDHGDSDYLLLNNASVGGKKSSLLVGQESSLDVTTLPDGSLQHTLIVTRTHTGTGVWPDFRNNNYIRIAVPLESVLSTAKINDLETQAVDITTEVQKTVFGIRLDTDPGHTSTLQLKYNVPAVDKIEPFTLKYQKQSGTLTEKLRVTLDGRTKFDGLVVKDTVIR